MNERNYFIAAFIVVAIVVYAMPIVFRLPAHPGQDLTAGLERLESKLVAEDWFGARVETQALEHGYEQLRRRLYLNSGPNDVRDFEESLSRLSVAVVEEDRLQARMEVAVLKQVLPFLSSY